MKQQELELSNSKLLYLFLALAFGYLSISYLMNHYLLTEDFYISVWSEQFSSDRVTQMLETSKKFEWIVYLLTPVILYLKMALITFSIQAGLYAFDIELSFKKIFQIVLIAEIIPFLNNVGAFLYFDHTGVYSFEQINSFAPLSLMSLLQANDLPSYITYPLQLINVFEFFYWVMLAIGLKVYLGKTFSKNFRLIASSYGVALLLWMVLVVFIQLQAS